MNDVFLVDTGPLVALLDRRDHHHAWAKAVFGRLRPPLLTCDAVLSEACFLLREHAGGPRAVLALVERNLIRPRLDVATEAATLGRLLSRYESVPMSLADACLVRMSEQLSGAVVVTCDADFRLYRRHGRQVLPVLMPPDPRRR